jgi:predicted TIM-barrel fold metal-dependent hydrolase
MKPGRKFAPASLRVRRDYENRSAAFRILPDRLRHPNLYICQDIYTFWPGGHLYDRQIDRLQDQFIFGTSYPFSSMSEPVEQTLKLPLRAAAMEKYLWRNGARLFKL